MKKNFITFGKSILVVSILTIINMCLLIGAFCLPTSPMRKHLADSYPLIEAEHPYLQWDQGYTSSMLDGWSEFTLYGIAINEDAPGTAFEKAMMMYFIDTYGLDRDASVLQYARYPDEYFEQSIYPRYWNGVVIFMKLLLLFFNIPDIRMINMFIQFALLAWIIALMVHNGLHKHLVPFITAILFINPITMAMSVVFSAEYYPMLISIIVILIYGKEIDKLEGGWKIFFAVVGAVTSFFCFLSSPGITLGVPLVVLLWFLGEKNVTKTVISSSLYWVGGYALTWVIKWIICTLFTEHNLIENAINQMTMYEDTANPGNSGASFIDRLMKNLWVYKTPAFILLFAAAVVLTVVMAFVYMKKKDDQRDVIAAGSKMELLDRIIGYGLVAMIPFAILIGLGNGYAYVHYFMAHRQLSIAALAALCVVNVLVMSLSKRKK